MTIELGPATREEIAFFYYGAGDQVTLRINDMPVALGCLREIGDRTWGMLDVSIFARGHGLSIVRAVRRYFERRNIVIYAVCGFPAAERLLTIIGFAPTPELVAEGKRVWRWAPRRA